MEETVAFASKRAHEWVQLPFVKRNLWVTILAHAFMDTILMLQMYLGAA